MAGSPNLCDKSWVTDQYDRYVRGNTVLAQPHDSGMIRVDERTNLGVAVSTDCNGRFAKLDPYAGAQLALAEAYRNVATGGATPLAISDCLNFGSPEDPDVMWQFAEACRGLKDACVELGIPVTGGNVSLYNQTGETAILPTPVVAVLGVIDDVTRRTPSAFVAEGERVFLLGTTREELSGSEWAHVVHGHLGGRPPALDLAGEQALAVLLREAVGLVTSAHDLSDGGLAQALVEATLRPRHRRRGRACPATRSSRCSPSRPVGCWSPCRDADADRLVDLAQRHGVDDHPARSHRRDDAVRRGSLRRAADRAPPGLDDHAARRLRMIHRLRRPTPASTASCSSPAGEPRGVVVVIHGGFWKAAYGLELGPPARRRPGRAGLGGLEPRVPPGRRRRRGAGDVRRRRRRDRPARRPRPGPLDGGRRSATPPAATWRPGRRRGAG